MRIAKLIYKLVESQDESSVRGLNIARSLINDARQQCKLGLNAVERLDAGDEFSYQRSEELASFLQGEIQAMSFKI